MCLAVTSTACPQSTPECREVSSCARTDHDHFLADRQTARHPPHETGSGETGRILEAKPLRARLGLKG
jgi:hypothetical protein